MKELTKIDISLKHLFVPLSNLRSIIFIVIIGLLVYGNALFNGFVWDDYPFILNNTEIRHFNISTLFGQSFFNHDGYYRPVQAAYFTFLYNVAGSHAFLYHFIQVSLHILYVILLFKFLQYFFKQTTSLLIAIIFLIHPINVESVSYISATVNQLFCIPGILALMIIQRGHLTLANYFYIAFLLLFSILAKESGILFMLATLVFVVQFRLKYFAKMLLMEVFVLITYLIIRLPSLQNILTDTIPTTGSNVNPLNAFSLQEKLLNIPTFIMYYLKTFIFPDQLAVAQIWTISGLDPMRIYWSLIIIMIFFVTLITLCVYLWKKNIALFRIYIFFFIWFLSGLVLHMPIFTPLYNTVADRWFYFPIIGLLGMTAIAASVFFKTSTMRKTIIICLVISIVLLSVRTIIRNSDFQDAITLFEHDSKNQRNYRLEGDLGELHLVAGNVKESLTHLRNTDNWHRSSSSLYNLGFWYEYNGSFSNAANYYEKAYNFAKEAKNIPNKAIYERLSYNLLVSGEIKRAKKFIDEGKLYYPESDYLWYIEARIQYAEKNLSDAVNAIKKAKSLKALEEYDLFYNTISKQGQMEKSDSLAEE